MPPSGFIKNNPGTLAVPVETSFPRGLTGFSLELVQKQVPPSFVRRDLLYSREKLVDAMLRLSNGFVLFGRHGERVDRDTMGKSARLAYMPVHQLDHCHMGTMSYPRYW